MSTRRYFLHLAYKGTNYFGWQVQPNQNSVQAELEKALSQLNSHEKVEVTGCGRTDTGVHASNYYAHFDLNKEWDLGQLKYKLNLILPADIAIKNVYLVAPELHARFSALSRTYIYRIHTTKIAFDKELSWYHRVELNVPKMNKACTFLLGKKSFECFSKSNTDVTHFDCEVTAAAWRKTDDGYEFTITANRFLRNMVRAIVGTLLEVGLDKISTEEFNNILASADRGSAGVSVPAVGLCLDQVIYPRDSFKS